MNWRLISIHLFTLFLLIGFQNCTQAPAPENVIAESSKVLSNITNITKSNGNGSIYDGKVYTNRILNGTCKDGRDLRSEIKVQDSLAFLTRDNCEDMLEPKPLTTNTVELYPHNTANLIFENKVFDNASEVIKPTIFLCRSHYKMRFEEGEFRVIGDITLAATHEKEEEFSAQLKFGIYNYAMKLLVPAFESGEMKLNRSEEIIKNRRFHSYKSTYSAGGKDFEMKLVIRKDNLEGWLDVNLAGTKLDSKKISIHDPPQFGFRVLCSRQ